MFGHSFATRLLLTVGGALFLFAPARAQPPDLGLRGQPYSSRGTVMYGPVTHYGAREAYQGAPVVTREPDIGFVSYYTSAYNPIFLTSINYPGVYGSYTIGVEARNYDRGRQFRYYAPAEGVALRDPVRLTAIRPPDISTPVTGTASISVRMPSDGELWFQGERMTKTGTFRDFVTPPLLTNREYSYDIRAIWRGKDGREVTRARQLTVRAGDSFDVDLFEIDTPATAVREPTLRTMPQPELRSKPR
jgi:uncharacterized protein (TIGR03000 family)